LQITDKKVLQQWAQDVDFLVQNFFFQFTFFTDLNDEM
jgi:hypothetical protein